MWTAADVVGTPASTEPVEVHQIGGAYTTALDIRIESGRLLTDGELNTAQPVALVNSRFVATRFNGRPPLGQIVRLPRLQSPPFSVRNEAFQVVGVVHDVLNEGLANAPIPEILHAVLRGGRRGSHRDRYRPPIQPASRAPSSVRSTRSIRTSPCTKSRRWTCC